MQEAVFSVRLGVGGALAVIIQHKSSLVSHAPENSVAGVEVEPVANEPASSRAGLLGHPAVMMMTTLARRKGGDVLTR